MKDTQPRHLWRALWALSIVILGCGTNDQLIASTDGGQGGPLGAGSVNCSTGPNFTGCPCNKGDQVSCYTGPTATQGVAPCTDGIQKCEETKDGQYGYGPCEGETVPTAIATCTIARDGGVVGGPDAMDTGTPACAGKSPRLVSPLSTSRATTNRPTLKWASSGPVTVSVCRDRACTSVIQSFSATGTTTRPPAALPAGVVYWRAEAQASTGCAASATWELKVPPRAASVDTSWGSFTDVNGDGISDLVLIDVNDDALSASAMDQSYGPPSLYVYQGTKAGLLAAPTTTVVVPEALVPFRSDIAALGGTQARSGDVNGDGYADVVALGQLFLGGPAGLSTTPAWSFSDPTLEQTLPIPSSPKVHYQLLTEDLGDVNGDGYADLVMTVSPGDDCWTGTPAAPTPPNFVGTRAYVFEGGPHGFSATAQTILDSFGAMTPGCTASLTGRCQAGSIGSNSGQGAVSVVDINGDGYGDVVISTLLPGRVLAYLGSPSGLTNAPTQTLLGPDGDSCWNVASGFASWGAAGDFDGKGYAEVLVGQWAVVGGNVGTGHLYSSSASGLASTATTYTAEETGNPVGNIEFGYPLGVRTGDVNGDGYADVLVGVLPSPGDPTGAELYLGGSSGLSPAQADKLVLTSSPPTSEEVQSSLNDDFNGDGLDDAVVSGWTASSSNVHTLFTLVYYSTGTGSQLPATPSWSLTPPAGSSSACCFE